MFMIVGTPHITQATVIAIIVSATIVVVALLTLIGFFASKTPADQEGGPLHYGNFYVVALGIMTALIGFLIAFPLLISGVFEDPTQVIALLSALFGTIVGLVGTYFGVKSSSDASQRAQDLAKEVTRKGNGSTDGPPGGATGETSNGTTIAPASEDTTGVVARTSPSADSEATDAQGDQSNLEKDPQEGSERDE
jgi:hypothetical protein